MSYLERTSPERTRPYETPSGTDSRLGETLTFARSISVASASEI